MTKKADFKIDWANITHQNVDCLKLMVNKTFPLSYPETLYEKIVVEYKDNTFFALVNDVPIGAISCRVWPRSDEGELKEKSSLYAIILSVLPPYRRFGIATLLLNEAIKRGKEARPDLYSIYLHTPETNETAIKFYQKNGFEMKEKKEGYYQSLAPDQGKDAVILEKIF